MRMRSFSRTTLTTFAALSAAVIALHAQQKEPSTFWFGPTAALEWGSASSHLPVYGDTPDCGEFTSGHSTSPSFGVAFIFPGFFSSRIGLEIDASGSMLWTTLHGRPTYPTVIAVDRNDSVFYEEVELDREFRMKSTVVRGRIDLLGRYSISERWSAGLGPSVGFQKLTSAEETDNILGPGDYSFPDGQSAHDIPGGERFLSNPLLFGLVARTGYALPVGRRSLLVPELMLRADFLSPVKGFAWSSYAAGVRVALLFDLTPTHQPPPPEPVADALPPTKAPVMPPLPAPTSRPSTPDGSAPAQPSNPEISSPRHPRLAARLEIYGLDEENHRQPSAIIRAQEVLYRQHAPLLSAVYFDHDSTSLAARYVHLPPAASDSFSVEDLAGQDPLAIQHQVLNVLGARLRADHSARVTLVPSTSSDESAAIAHDRAEAVRSYLETAWGIEKGRIGIREGSGLMQRSNEATEDGRQDNRRVELIPSSPAILGRVVTDEVVREFNPPAIKMNPFFDAEAGVKEWTLVVRQGPSVVARYSSRDTGDLARKGMVWNIVRDQIDSALTPITATLRVMDSTGASTVADASIPLLLERKTKVVDKRIQIHGDREQISFGLTAFDYNSVSLGNAQEQEVKEIVATLRDSARVIVTGYTDRVGDERYNVELSTQRAEKVATALRAASEARGIVGIRLTASGAGAQHERFDNSLPEGRGLSRGVVVLVDQSAIEYHNGE